MSSAVSKKFYTPAEYYELEAKAAYKSDYFNGEISPCGEIGPNGQLISMAGGSVRHSMICSNILAALSPPLKGGACRVFESNVRLRIRSTGLRTYPDVSVYGGQREHDPEDAAGQTLLNPTVLFEILSPSTESYDRGIKSSHYHRIESLRTIVFVTQREARIEVHQRNGNGDWVVQDLEGTSAILHFPDIPADLPLSEIYDGVDFQSDR